MTDRTAPAASPADVLAGEAPDPLAGLLVPLPVGGTVGAGTGLDLRGGVEVVLDDNGGRGPVPVPATAVHAAAVTAHLAALLDADRGARGGDRGADQGADPGSASTPGSGERGAVATVRLRLAPDPTTSVPAVAPIGFADERHRVTVGPDGAELVAATPEGLARAAATFLQLVERSGREVLAADLHDGPRVPWRGLLVDCVRHFQPLDHLRRTIDAMALAKLNVLHLHLTDDQAWRVESRAFPDLVARAAPGGHYTLDELAALVDHATSRGVRIVPELDVPGHTSALLVAMPHLALGDPPAAVPTGYVVPNVAVDPGNDEVYEVLGTILGEWTDVFPDRFVHLGGDEAPVVGDERQAGFTVRMVELARAHGRTTIVWDEAMHPDLPRDVVVQAWRAPAKLYHAVRAGHRAILSSGWYLDLGLRVDHLHAVDPHAAPADLEAAVLAPWRDRVFSAAVGKVATEVTLGVGSLAADAPDGPTAPFTEAERALVLGGEACLWAERVPPRLLDGYLWPAAAAVADRLWGAPGVDHPTLAPIADRLDLVPDLRRWTEVRPARGHRELLAELAAESAAWLAGGSSEVRGASPGAAASSPPDAEAIHLALALLADWCEPVRWYARAAVGWPQANGRSDDAPVPGTEQPLDRFVDALATDASASRWWRARAARSGTPPGGADADAHVVVGTWREPDRVLGALLDAPSRLAEPARLARRLAESASALAALLADPPAERADATTLVRELRAPLGEATVAVHAVFAAVAAP